MPQTPILIIDDNESHITLYNSALNDAGFKTVCARSKAEAVALATQHKPRIALVDLVLPDGTGNDLITTLRAQNPNIRAIVITAYASVDRAVEAMRLGVFDFLVKPVDPQTLLNAVTNARSDRNHLIDPKHMTQDAPPLGGLIGSSEAMKTVYATIRAVAGSVATVFITGENGTGKAQCAEAIHALSTVSEGPFVPVNCSAIADGYSGVEIFGHVAGALPGHDVEKIGAAQRAHGGTLFLDEVCELDSAAQAQLLQLLQTSSVTPHGAATPRDVKIRIICASATDPLEQVKSGHFRADLYYRLNVVPIHLPPLRDRGMDVIEIAEAMVIRYAAKEKRPARLLSQEAKALFLSYAWPGNIRELMNLLWHCVVISNDQSIELQHMPHHMQDMSLALEDTSKQHPTQVDLLEYIQGKTLAEIEREVIEIAIARAGGSIPLASKSLGVSPSTIYRKLETWGRPARGPRNVETP
jgi:two-component system repressor protein LuxO